MRLRELVRLRQAYDLSVSIPPISPLSLHTSPLKVTSPGTDITPKTWRSWSLVLQEEDRSLVVDPLQRYLIVHRKPGGEWFEGTSREMLGQIGRENALRRFGTSK
jgi:hypothetical protein